MKYIKTFENINNIPMILYHGSPYKFKTFNHTTTFFSETKSFAVDYSDTKSFDYALDAEPNLYTVKVNGNIFDPTKKSDMNKLRKLLPPMVSYAYNNFGFKTEVPRDEILFNMSGKVKQKPYEPAVNAGVGEEFPDPYYNSDSYVVYKRDDDFVYAYNKKSLNYITSEMFNDITEMRNSSSYRKYFKEIREFVDDYIKADNDKKNMYISHGIRQAYVIRFFNNDSDRYSYGVEKIPDDIVKKFNILYKKTMKDIIAEFTSKYNKKFILKPRVVDLEDTWRYFENDTVHNNILKLGYDGYVAKEKNIKTYAIFDPGKTVDIISYEFPHGIKFDSWKDWEDYIAYDGYIAKHIDKDSLYSMSRYEPYRLYKAGVSVEEAVNRINNKE
jgi:hypothetical protein